MRSRKAKDRTRGNICEYFEDYDLSLTPRSSHLTFLRWVLISIALLMRDNVSEKRRIVNQEGGMSKTKARNSKAEFPPSLDRLKWSDKAIFQILRAVG